MGCVTIPVVFLLMLFAYQLIPMIVAIVIAVALGKSDMNPDSKTPAIIGTVIAGIMLNAAFLALLYGS
jgi:hypothetical protein